MVEEDELISGNLDLLVASDEIDKASLVERVIYLPPLHDEVVLDFFCLLEKQDLVGGSGHQDLAVDEVHLGQVRAVKLLVLELGSIVAVDGNGLAESIETMNLESQKIEETIVWVVQI